MNWNRIKTFWHWSKIPQSQSSTTQVVISLKLFRAKALRLPGTYNAKMFFPSSQYSFCSRSCQLVDISFWWIRCSRHTHPVRMSLSCWVEESFRGLTVLVLVGRLSVVSPALLSRIVWKTVDCFWGFWKRVLNPNRLFPTPCQTTIQVFWSLDNENDSRPGSSVLSTYILWRVVSSFDAGSWSWALWVLQQVPQD